MRMAVQVDNAAFADMARHCGSGWRDHSGSSRILSFVSPADTEHGTNIDLRLYALAKPHEGAGCGSVLGRLSVHVSQFGTTWADYQTRPETESQSV
jgi:hypothetical protein